MNMERPPPPLKIVDKLVLNLIDRSGKAKYNLLNISINNFQSLYKISGGILPNRVQLP